MSNEITKKDWIILFKVIGFPVYILGLVLVLLGRGAIDSIKTLTTAEDKWVE